MGLKQSTAQRTRAFSTTDDVAVHESSVLASQNSPGNSAMLNSRSRSRSLTGLPVRSQTDRLRVLPPLPDLQNLHGLDDGSDSDESSADVGLPRALLSSGLPLRFFAFRDIKCPVCKKLVPPDDFECHVVICFTKPRITYNEDVLTEDKGECVICFDELTAGDTIARLPCLCIYHKGCIDKWFEINRSCPEHPPE